MLGAFGSKAHFPIPDLLICSVGATCDDLSGENSDAAADCNDVYSEECYEVYEDTSAM